MSLIGIQIGQNIHAFELADKIIPDLYNKAINDGNILEYNKHGISFKYASIKASEHSETKEITSVLLYACHKGDMIVVFEDLVDAMFKEYGAVHEYGELPSQSHFEGIRLEMEIARKEGNLESYLKWIEQNYPQRLKELRHLNIYSYNP